MKFEFKKTSRFKKDYKKVSANPHFNEGIFIKVLGSLVVGKKLDAKYKDHKLKGVFKDCRECHLQNDVLLIYEVKKKANVISLLRIGSHFELF